MHDAPQKCSTVEDWLKQADAYARKEPTKTAAAAFFAGVAINVLPVGGILVLLAKTSFHLLRPALLVLGAVKAYELCNTPPKNNP